MTSIQRFCEQLEKSEAMKYQTVCDVVEYLRGISEVGRQLENLRSISTDTLVNSSLDEATKGRLLGIIDVCEAVLKMF